MPDGKITFDETEISMPEFPYKSILELPFDIVSGDDGSVDINDEGSTYDKRRCQATFILNATEMNNINQMLSNGIYRYQDVAMSLPAGSGFFPFMPDKGDEGDFDVAIRILSHGTIQSNPFKQFAVKLEIVNTGSYPAYSLPAQVGYGSVTMGTISQCRFPGDYFSPDIEYARNFAQEENASVQYIDRGSGGDYYRTTIPMRENESKTAAIINYLTQTARAASFDLKTGANAYAFGRDKGNEHTVKIVTNKIVMTHYRYDDFEFSLRVANVN